MGWPPEMSAAEILPRCPFLMVRCLLLLLLLLLHNPALAGPLTSRVESMISSGAAARALWGVYAVDADSGAVVADVNGSRLFVPASTRKLVTTAVTTTLYSAGERFSTELIAGSITPAGVLDGNLVLRAGGDPTWSADFLSGANGTSRLRELARLAAREGLKQVRGDLVIDHGRFSEPDFLGHGWTWNNLAMSFSPRPSALAINGNTAGIGFTPTRAGEAISWNFPLGASPFEVRNEAMTGRPGSVPTLTVDLLAGGEVLLLKGNLPQDSAASSRLIPVGDPVGYTARLFLRELEREGITVSGRIRVGRNVQVAGGRSIARVESAPISEIVAKCNRDSDNFLAEMLFLQNAAKRFGAGNHQGARQVEQAYWERIGVASGHYDGIDGSGLSRENYVTPLALTRLLQDRRGVDWFVESLPVSGRTGTLRHRLSQDGMAGRVRAKTGTLNGVTGLAGYATTNSGRTVIFAVLANNYTASHAAIRRQIDEIVTEFARR